MADAKKRSKPAKKKMGWKPGSLIKKAVKKIKAKRTAKQIKKNTKKIGAMAKKNPKSVTTTAKTLKQTKKLKATGKIRKGAKSVKVTQGGAYASYGKKTKAAKSFRSSFAAAKKAGKKTFTWDGRKYSTKSK
tara:strand:- start:6406 stop:6801 length:396 start_codon:yes stop_codon:yes gene_type:complete